MSEKRTELTEASTRPMGTMLNPILKKEDETFHENSHKVRGQSGLVVGEENPINNELTEPFHRTLSAWADTSPVKIFANPRYPVWRKLNRNVMLSLILIFAIIGAICFAVTLDLNSVYVVLFGVVFSPLVWILDYIGDFFRRPEKVGIRRSEVQLYYRTGKIKYLPWPMVTGLWIGDDSEPFKHGIGASLIYGQKWDKKGRLLNDGWYVPLTVEIAREISKTYSEEMGKLIPSRRTVFQRKEKTNYGH